MAIAAIPVSFIVSIYSIYAERNSSKTLPCPPCHCIPVTSFVVSLKMNSSLRFLSYTTLGSHNITVCPNFAIAVQVARLSL
ncbi:hypothetical protein EDD85DRAFT_859473 [Armillaria nabsnona]|nr:hypothetical protein EDD85DRAFT_859473 [Armillaria nabsnona]